MVQVVGSIVRPSNLYIYSKVLSSLAASCTVHQEECVEACLKLTCAPQQPALPDALARAHHQPHYCPQFLLGGLLAPPQQHQPPQQALHRVRRPAGLQHRGAACARPAGPRSHGAWHPQPCLSRMSGPVWSLLESLDPHGCMQLHGLGREQAEGDKSGINDTSL